ncbi:alanyl-tRNA synthetase domain-containing protein 1 [Basidiobolus meristosporus CBS 931.73]|uniref:Alanyl-tRNA synthetase domain-containing protein 1 n=1 Tax=Basidiobolus meristosporus CBS 931.73 TaxID=1314790 RepID=A0A1Y1Y985_9FUNG|nr:alanyl-tRNA synthetase domain-containing protein 1 [Basidiobolus meristosporus CBS 931.73]|eukprot:ORX94571.1 alanyl-tRNA synthetase domain-containing protein 1 [Basidiobolus meristosporus CBS 931.73]
MATTQLEDTKPALVGALACQLDPYRKEIKTTVYSCTDKPNSDGLYEIELLDTVLFPEGGGQPHDTGFIDDVEVVNVQRKGLDCIHYAKGSLAVGSTVIAKVDYERRWDHMQQHSGQHLISAVMESEFGFETLSWNLGLVKSHIELDTKNATPTQEQIDKLEALLNDKIRSAISVNTVHIKQHDGAESNPDSLPKDYVGGVVRYVRIDGLDNNACCGTHVNNLKDLQVIKLLHTERIRGTNTCLFFLVGDRVTQYLHQSYARERALTASLSCGPESHVDAVSKTQKQYKDTQKAVKSLLKEIADYVGKELVEAINDKGYITYHREDADMTFLNLLTHHLKVASPESVALLCGGPKKEGGPIIIIGNPDKVKKCSDIVTETLANVKGGGKGRWQGKTSSWTNLETVFAKVSETLTSLEAK